MYSDFASQSNMASRDRPQNLDCQKNSDPDD